ncbi:lipocalin family protein [Aquimarina sp. W85]|uniref:lipocalin family protein n=1 Tax=Aquimarina rhodophyticola TaxID=3342246 RepID=UPI00366E83B5
MKNLLYTISFLMVFWSCAEKKEAALVGTWKLSEVLVDPGNGKGTFQKANQEKVITFFADGTLKTNVSYCNMAKDTTIGKAGSYSIADSKLRITCDTSESNIDFKLNDGELIIDFPTQCIESCKEKYIKVK